MTDGTRRYRMYVTGCLRPPKALVRPLLVLSELLNIDRPRQSQRTEQYSSYPNRGFQCLGDLWPTPLLVVSLSPRHVEPCCRVSRSGLSGSLRDVLQESATSSTTTHSAVSGWPRKKTSSASSVRIDRNCPPFGPQRYLTSVNRRRASPSRHLVACCTRCTCLVFLPRSLSL